jgi:transcriptional regulator with XRE-family HTH domain
MTVGEKLRKLRQTKGLTLRGLASQVDVGFTYLSRVETGTMTYGDYPSEALIHRLADALEADEDELLLLAKKIPERIRKRFFQRPDVFGALAECDDQTLDKVMRTIRQTHKPK